MNKSISVNQTPISGLLKFELVVNKDERGSFTELYQAEKLSKLGLKDFQVVQTNLSVNNQKGVIRGIHAEPWNKFITPLKGEVFVAVVDLRADSFGKVLSFELGFGQALFVPKGCANSYQTLSNEVYYLYHVDDHWKPGLTYPSLHCFDKQLKINWPIPQASAILSDKDKSNPRLDEVKPL